MKRSITLVIHYAVDAKVQIGAVELEKFAQKGLELSLIIIHIDSSSGRIQCG